MKNLYEILEVNPRARDSVIEAAYRTLIKEYHPDKGGDPKRAAKINEAKRILLDEKERQKYDEEINSIEGKALGNYKVLEKIAEGGFGTTYKAVHTTTDCLVCVKHANNISPEDEELLVNEAKAMWDLRHYGIPAVRDLLKLEDGSLALVTSYVPGPTLEQIITKIGKMEAEDVAWITSRTLNILKYLHYHGVVHGDVKPQNIIIQPDTHAVVLVDYGLSSIKPRSGSTNRGYTPDFAPPEQYSGRTLLPQSDFYSLGITMIYSLGGDIRGKRVPDKTPELLCDFIKRMIVKDVLARPGWEKEDLFDTFDEIRQKCFGRSHSGFKKIKGWDK